MYLFAAIIHWTFSIYTLMLFVRILASWIPQLQNNTFIRFIGFCTDPYLNLFRKIIPAIGMIDISPIFAFFALQIGERVILSLLF